MNCSEAREVISSALDGELAAGEAPSLTDHLVRCAACRAWQEDAHVLTRRARLSLVTEVPAPDPSLVDTVLAVSHESGTSRGFRLARIGLLLIAAAQVALTIPPLLLGTDRDAPVHVAHEMGSFDLALAAGYLVAARRPERARGLRSLVGVAALLLLITAVIDLLARRTTLPDEAPHLLTIAGWFLLAYLAHGSHDERERDELPLLRRPPRAAPPTVRPVTADPDVRRAAGAGP